MYYLFVIVILLLAVSTSFAANVTPLHQKDFRYGTYVIDQPGTYRLEEDISFNPNHQCDENVWAAGRPEPDQLTSNGGPYDDRAYSLGFFAAIAITCEDVVIDLNGYTLEQSVEHALLQRFFAIIELADQPFVPFQGPSDFGARLKPAKNVVIKDGTLGRSSHHGIHGNANEDVVIKNVEFDGYEVGAVALNGASNVRITDCEAANRKDVPVVGLWSALRFIQPYIDFLVEEGSTTRLNVRGESLSAADVQSAVRTAQTNVYNDVVKHGFINEAKHPAEFAAFHNPLHLLDGNSYSFLFNQNGVAVNGFPSSDNQGFTMPSRNVLLKDIQVTNQSAFILEIPALEYNGVAILDPVGSVFQVLNKHPRTHAPVTIDAMDFEGASYVGNVVADAQLLVAKGIHAGEFLGSSLSTVRNSITTEVVDWAEGQIAFSELLEPEGFICNGDSMFHVNKGVIAFKMDGTVGIRVQDVDVEVLNNFGSAGSDVCGDYQNSKSHPLAALNGYGGAVTRGFSVAGTAQGEFSDIDLEHVFSANGDAVGFDVFTSSSRIEIHDTHVEDLIAPEGKSIGHRISGAAKRVEVSQYKCCNLEAGADEVCAIDESSKQAKNSIHDERQC